MALAPQPPPDAQPPASGERALVRRLGQILAAGMPTTPGSVPFGDDLAPIPGQPQLLWSTDMILDGVDFDSTKHDWHSIGRKALAVNLSDCAAMATKPLAALIALGIHERLGPAVAETIVRAAAELGDNYECPVVGGDTNAWSGPTTISVTVIAKAAFGVRPVRRAGARPGDSIWVTGPLGGSLLGRHLWFQPRVREALEIGRRLHPHAMIDISDGFAIDLSRILEASGVGAVVDRLAIERLVHADAEALAAESAKEPWEHALNDGEDFELLLTLPPHAPLATCRELGLQRVGVITDRPGELLLDFAGRRTPLPVQGWEYFR